MLEYLFLIPVLHFILIYLVSVLRKTTHLMFDLWAIPYLDWFFVPFNYFFATSIIFSLKLFLICVAVSLLGTIYLHHKWKPKTDSRRKYFFMDRKGLTPEGWIHFVFMVVQGGLIFTLLLSKPVSIHYVYCLLALLAYLLGYLIIVKFIRKNLYGRVEVPFFVLGAFLVLLRLVLYF